MNFALARKKLGLTQSDIANEIGVNQATVCGWESGKFKPNVRIVPKVAAAYHVTVEDLLSDSGDSVSR